MSILNELTSIVKRLEAIEKIFAEYRDSVRATQERERQLDSSPRLIRSEIAFDEASKADNKAEADRQYRVQNRISWSAFLAFCAALIYAGIALDQWIEMHTQTQEIFRQAEVENNDAGVKAAQWLAEFKNARDQVNAAQASAEAIQKQTQQDQRPWLKITFGLNEPRVQFPISGTIHIVNGGKTPARHVIAKVVVEQVKNGEGPKLNYAGPGMAVTTGTLFPNEPPVNLPIIKRIIGTDGKGTNDIFTDTESDDFMNGRIFYIIYGTIYYTDFFGTNHWTKYCSFHAAQGFTFTAQNCTNYGDIDKN
jgi:hypothetical protein